MTESSGGAVDDNGPKWPGPGMRGSNQINFDSMGQCFIALLQKDPFIISQQVCLFVCLFVCVCESYVMHHLVSTGLRCAPSTCVVHHHVRYQFF